MNEHNSQPSAISLDVILIGASGNAGSRILHELQSRGHDVTAVVRNPERLPAGVKYRRDDLSSIDRIQEIISGADAVVSAYNAPPNEPDQLVNVTAHLVEAVRSTGNPRLIMVGGAASLEIATGLTAIASGRLPKKWVPEATAHSNALELLKASDIDWTYFSPAAFFEPGERTGKFRLGGNSLIIDEKGNSPIPFGNSRISFEGYAVALVDELERPERLRSQFTIGY
jgi:putative NADH-flavin reductase